MTEEGTPGTPCTLPPPPFFINSSFSFSHTNISPLHIQVTLFLALSSYRMKLLPQSVLLHVLHCSSVQRGSGCMCVCVRSHEVFAKADPHFVIAVRHAAPHFSPSAAACAQTSSSTAGLTHVLLHWSLIIAIKVTFLRLLLWFHRIILKNALYSASWCLILTKQINICDVFVTLSLFARKIYCSLKTALIWTIIYIFFNI